ncbi:auxin-responsive protein IAA29-like [Alnus glutinosa]|uniref:auxin-responsive protein IAA29-like n=1 Tax=Alnus glutinosa TaxID=3517 RepID=UPI002D76CB10|nr:auxin-responsive protein IAA29-like [Alnus glutinosa]
MELQLGLALPTNPPKGFDLNYYGYEPKELVVSDLWFNNHADNKKRSFCQAFENSTDRAVPRTLPLLLWNNHPNEEDDPKDYPKNDGSLFAFNENDGDRDGVVGWPPIKSWRNNYKRVCHDNYRGGRRLLENATSTCGGGRRSNSMYVKVKMEGVGIGRKVDVGLHHSFQTLTETLLDMFRKWLLETGQENSNNYKLVYQDKEGDWLYTQDVSWRTFIGSVQRLKLLKISG